jgi:predicted secreted acid phosphatase
MLKRLALLLATGAMLALTWNRGFAAEPANLDIGKTAVRAYVDSGRYAQDLADVAASATRYLAQRIPKGTADKKMAVIFDIDETTLSNLPHLLAQDFGYVGAVWDRWVLSSQARAIAPVQTIYDLAVRSQVAVFFITGRDESQRRATEENLRTVGFKTWTKAYFRPSASTQAKPSARAYKTAIRRELVAESYVIIANIGDQDSDLAGGYAEKTFKLPNPFYRIE